MATTLALLELDLPAADIAVLEASLGPAERERAGQYRFARDASRFIARRGQLRLLLGRIMDRAPDRLSFDHGAFGRPFVTGGPDFNIAHSGAIGLCAISTHGQIGCDIERRDPRLADRAIAERLFTRDEYRALADLPADRWTQAFFDCWTRKEAIVKALGVGLSRPLDSFAVPMAPSDGAALPTSFPGLHVQGFDTVPDFSIAICAAEQADPPHWFRSSTLRERHRPDE